MRNIRVIWNRLVTHIKIQVRSTASGIPNSPLGLIARGVTLEYIYRTQCLMSWLRRRCSGAVHGYGLSFPRSIWFDDFIPLPLSPIKHWTRSHACDHGGDVP